MAYLVRKITRAKWEPGNDLAAGEIPADAVTVDLRTSSNCLSFWQLKAPSEHDEISRIALVFATAAERIDRIDLAWIEKEKVNVEGISIEASDGRTPVQILRSDHVDAIKLDLKRLSRVFILIADALRLRQHRRFTRKELINIIVAAVRDDLVSINDLAPKVKEEIKKEFGI